MRIRVLIAMLVAAAAFLIALTHLDRAEASPDPTRPPMRACLSDEGESAFPCVWYAPTMGNGKGHSFRIYRDGRVKQIPHERAYHLLGDCNTYGPVYC